MKTGVFNCQITLDLSKIDKLYEYLLEHIKSRQVKARIRRELRKTKKDDGYFSFKEAISNFSHAVYDMLKMKKYPEEIEKLEKEFEELKWLSDMSTPMKKKLAILDCDIEKCRIQILRQRLEIDKLKLWKTKVRELHRRAKKKTRGDKP